MDSKIIMPWEERPEGCSDVMWRYSKNPKLARLLYTNRGSFAMLFHFSSSDCHNKCRCRV